MSWRCGAFRIASRGRDGSCRSVVTTASRDPAVAYAELRHARCHEIETLAELKASAQLRTFLETRGAVAGASSALQRRRDQPATGRRQHEMSPTQTRLTLDAMLATFCLHVESRVAAALGVGYYTIGPCGEEAVASAALALGHPEDSVALHYRHLGIALARQLLRKRAHHGEYVPLVTSVSDVLLDRARGYTVSRNDPVVRGVHCSLGSPSPESPSGGRSAFGGDFVVTSTLASQCSPAVGRALAYSRVRKEQHETRRSSEHHPPQQPTREEHQPVSFVTVGDGSVHNAHFWSAFHLARHARHRRIKCPVVFGVADNGLSISYPTRGYVDTLFAGDDPLVPAFVAHGGDMMDVYDKTSQAVTYARRHSAPAVVLYQNLVRRFGHAASDRQAAYLDESQIQAMADHCVVERNVSQAVEAGAVSYPELLDRFNEIRRACVDAFDQAAREPKVDRDDMVSRASAPAVAVPRLPDSLMTSTKTDGTDADSPAPKREVMRKLMTRVLAESLEFDPSVVYMGEDVQHGGYYVVTEGLAQRFPGRVVDFPPDETSLLGAALGFAQSGLLPIVEIPYAKYLDCGADMFAEIALTHWLSGSSRRSNGMVIRLQGFDRGLFGGNFHTHNALAPPPGVDLLCFSNGEDYVRGFRHAMLQAKAGRIAVIVDCTHLLNLRHLFGKDRAWERPYPPNDEHGLLNFDEIRRFGTTGHVAIVSFGTGVVAALQARRTLFETQHITCENEIDIIDCPCLTQVPSGLSEVIGRYSGVVFADICKGGPGTSVMSSTATSLHNKCLLPDAWRVVAAPRTYNPLGSLSTFLSSTDIVACTLEILPSVKCVQGHSNLAGGRDGQGNGPQNYMLQ